MPSPDDRLAQLLARITDDLHGGRQPDIDALVASIPGSESTTAHSPVALTVPSPASMAR